MKTPEELTDLAFFLFAPDDADYERYIVRREHMIRDIRTTINAALEEVAVELENTHDPHTAAWVRSRKKEFSE